MSNYFSLAALKSLSYNSFTIICFLVELFHIYLEFVELLAD